MIPKLARRIKSFISVFLASVLLCVAVPMLTACDPDIKTDEAIAIAKRDFGCEKILWIGDTNALMLCQTPGEDPPFWKIRSNYAYYVVGEKAGREIYLVIPSTPKLDAPYVTTWNLDYTFMQIVEKFNENGANYVADVPDNYYDYPFDYIEFVSTKDEIIRCANLCGLDAYEFYDRLDIKGIFYYQWMEGYKMYACIITQESGELKAYKY